MKITRLTAVGIALIVAAFANAQSARKEFEKGYRDAAMAFKKRDINWFENTMAPNMKWKSADGQGGGKAQAVAQLKQLFAMTKSIDCKFTIKSLKVKGNTATTVVEQDFKMTMKPGKNKKSSKITMKGPMTQTFVKGKSGWKETYREDLPGMKMTLDGKPLDPKTMGKGGG